MNKILSIVILAALCGTARAVEYYWQGAVSGDLGDTNNFVLTGSFKTNVLPQAADNLNINSSLYPVTNRISSGTCRAKVTGGGTAGTACLMGGLFTNAVYGTCTISNGVFTGAVYGFNAIADGVFSNLVCGGSGKYTRGGTFYGTVTNQGPITAGTFNGVVYQAGSVSGGTFNNAVIGTSMGTTVSGGTFNGYVYNAMAQLSGGVYNGIVSNAYQILGGTYSNTVVNCYSMASISGGTFCGNVVFANNVKLNGGTFRGGVSVLSGSQVWTGTLNGISSLTLWDSPEMRPLSKWPAPERGINGSAILGMP